jgi:DNA-directed RNA polymerase subunit K/omega
MAPLKKQNIKSSSTSNKIEDSLKKKDYDNDDSSNNSSDSDDNILNGSGSDSNDDDHDDSDNDNNKDDDNNDENDDGEDAIGNDEEIDDEDEDEKEEDTEEDEESEESEEEEYEDKDDDCLYKFATHKSTLFEDDGDIDEANFFIDEENTTTRDVYISNDQRITKPVLTKYERVRILGERARQLSLGAKPMIKSVENIDPKDIAHAELKMKVIPLIIIRTLPTGEKEKWKLNELAIIN